MVPRPPFQIYLYDTRPMPWGQIEISIPNPMPKGLWCPRRGTLPSLRRAWSLRPLILNSCSVTHTFSLLWTHGPLAAALLSVYYPLTALRINALAPAQNNDNDRCQNPHASCSIHSPIDAIPSPSLRYRYSTSSLTCEVRLHLQLRRTSSTVGGGRFVACW